MDDFSTRRDEDIDMTQYNKGASGTTTFKQSERNGRLPCMSSFVFQKRQRLQLKSSPSLEKPEYHSYEFCHEDNDVEEPENDEDCNDHQSTATRHQDGPHVSTCNDDVITQFQRHSANTDLSDNQRTDLSVTIAMCQEPMVPIDSPRCFYGNEQCSNCDQEAPHQFHVIKACAEKDPTDGWNFPSNQTALFHKMPMESSYNELLSPEGYMAYTTDDINNFSNELQSVPEPGEGTAFSDLYNPPRHDFDEPTLEQNLQKDHTISRHVMPGVGLELSADISINHFPSSILSAHLGTAYESNPTLSNPDYAISDMQWPNGAHLHSGALDNSVEVNCTTPSNFHNNNNHSNNDNDDDDNCTVGVATDDVINDPSDGLTIIDDDISGDILKSKGRKTDMSYIALISKAILSSQDQRMLLSDIYDYLSQNCKDIKSNQRAWRNSVRHNLSLNECFVKQERLGRGRGHYWSIHPACVDDFIKGDFRRRQARRRAKKSSLRNHSNLTSDCTPTTGPENIVGFPSSGNFQKLLNMQLSGDMTYHEMM